MDEAACAGGQAVGMANRSPDEIRHDIEQTREELGETVEALAAKTDVKAQAQARIEEVKQQARATVDDVKHRVEAARAGNGGGPGSSLSAGASRDPARLARQGVQRARLVASQNPKPVAAIAGFVGGLIVARLMRRR
jgi:alanyl-tRNA synthetase